jgi:hypothetical protein
VRTQSIGEMFRSAFGWLAGLLEGPSQEFVRPDYEWKYSATLDPGGRNFLLRQTPGATWGLEGTNVQNLRPRRDDFLGQMIIPARGRFTGNYVVPGSEIPVLELQTAGLHGLGDSTGTALGMMLFAAIGGGLLYLWATRKAGSGRLIRNPRRKTHRATPKQLTGRRRALQLWRAWVARRRRAREHVRAAAAKRRRNRRSR